jgi:hypothetical protein
MMKPIFCCGCAAPWQPPIPPFNDPLRGQHEAIFRDFVAYAIRANRIALDATTAPFSPTSASSSSPQQICSSQDSQIMTPPISPSSDLASLQTGSKTLCNTITHQTPHVIHLETRNDFGPVISHRYFAPSLETQTEWVEVPQKEYWQAPDSYQVVGDKKTFKCPGHDLYFKIMLKPNLSHRMTMSPPKEDRLGK